MPATYDSIATATANGVDTITFSSIPNTYTDLRLVFICKFGTADIESVGLRFNSDTGSNYSTTYIFGNGSSANSARTTSATAIRLDNFNSFFGTQPALSNIDIFSYAGSTNKSVLFQSAHDRNGGGFSSASVGLWRNTSAINSISIVSFSPNFTTGTTATLYGILRA